jgi:hypothetical protein
VATGKYVTAKVVHFENGPVVEASTSEWAIKKQLYKPNDTSAYINLARVRYYIPADPQKTSKAVCNFSGFRPAMRTNWIDRDEMRHGRRYLQGKTRTLPENLAIERNFTARTRPLPSRSTLEPGQARKAVGSGRMK